MVKFSFEKVISQYDYVLPESFIAQAPITPRDHAKLLVYDRQTKKTIIDTFTHLVSHLPKNSVLVMNQTKVIPARLKVKKETGGVVEILFLEEEKNTIRVLANKKLEPLSKLILNSNIQFVVSEKNANEYTLIPSFPIEKLQDILEKYGTTPIPPYIKHTTLSEKKLRKEYQTVFAKTKGSVAAPTASLHFTKKLLGTVTAAGHDIQFITLHVNLGTFAKLTEKHVAHGRLHKEWYEIDPNTAEKLDKAKKIGQPIIAVGTTVVRTLESAADTQGKLKKLTGTTDLFITEDYKMRFVNHVITNFHVPKSSLLMLVAAFLGRKKMFKLYKIAQENNFRFFSFGDGMLIK